MAEYVIRYRLDEAGQRASILSGGSGAAVQDLTLDAEDPHFKRFVALASIRPDGDAMLDLSGGRWNGYRHIVGYRAVNAYDSPRIDTVEQPCSFSTPQTVAGIIAAEKERLEGVAASKAAADAEYRSMRAAWGAQQAELQAQATAKREAETAAATAKREAETARQRATEEARVAWIAERGSDHLRRATAAGYRCHRLYITERAAMELGPDYELDWDGLAAWRVRSCPTPQALTEAERLDQLGARVVWLTVPPWSTTSDDDEDDESDESLFEPCEAVVLRDLFGTSLVAVRCMGVE